MKRVLLAGLLLGAAAWADLDAVPIQSSIVINAKQDGRMVQLNLDPSLAVYFDGGVVGSISVSTTQAQNISMADAGFNNITVAAESATSVQLTSSDAGNLYVVSGHNTAAQAIEVGSDAGTSGVLSVTFAVPFNALPVCSCTHVDTTNANACSLDHTKLPSTTAAQFKVSSGGSDVIDWMCVGNR